MTSRKITLTDSIVAATEYDEPDSRSSGQRFSDAYGGMFLTKPWWETKREAFRNNGRARVTGTGPSWQAV